MQKLIGYVIICNHCCIQSTLQRATSPLSPVAPGCPENTLHSDKVVLRQGKPNPGLSVRSPQTLPNPMTLSL